jgi:hypothetical protein
MTDDARSSVPPAPFPGTTDEWRVYLTEYSDWFLNNATDNYLYDVSEQQISSRWVGYEPADEQLIAATEERLGVVLPPSLRAFLRTSDGWGPVAGWTDALRPCADIEWFHETHASFVDAAEEDDDEELDNGVFRHSLSIARGEDAFLLDTREILPNGEYRAHHLAVKYGDLSEPCTSFSELLTLGRTELEDVI